MCTRVFVPHGYAHLRAHCWTCTGYETHLDLGLVLCTGSKDACCGISRSPLRKVVSLNNGVFHRFDLTDVWNQEPKQLGTSRKARCDLYTANRSGSAPRHCQTHHRPRRTFFFEMLHIPRVLSATEEFSYRGTGNLRKEGLVVKGAGRDSARQSGVCLTSSSHSSCIRHAAEEIGPRSEISGGYMRVWSLGLNRTTYFVASSITLGCLE